MKKIALIYLTLMLSGCFGPATFDSTTEASIKDSSGKIIKGLPASKHEEFQKALMYFSIGGEAGLKTLLSSAFSGNSKNITNEAMLNIKLKVIDGLTGEQILDKYRASIEQGRIKQEKEDLERNKEKLEREKVTNLKKEALKLTESKKFQEALSKYKAMSEISSGVKDAEVGIEDTTTKMKEFTEKMDYIDKVEITEFLAERIDTYREKGTPAVRISLKNKGDRALDKVEVVVYFKDEAGKIIYEENFHPVFVSKYSFSGDNKPLKPGYIKEMGKGKYYTIKSALSEWKIGQASAKVVDIEFSPNLN